MANPHQAVLFSQPSGNSNAGMQKTTGGSSSGASSSDKGKNQGVEGEGEREAEYESSHRRRKVISSKIKEAFIVPFP